MALVGSLLPLMFLRRTKDIIADQLPKKQDNIVLCPLTPLQKSVYKKFIASYEVQLILTINEPCECGAKDQDGKPYQKGKCCHQDETKGLIFKYISLFLKISNHLALLYPDNTESVTNPVKFEQARNWTKLAFPDDWHTRHKSPLNFTDPTLCGKWVVLEGLLKLWKETGAKVLIFSNSLQVLGLLKDLMCGASYNYCVLDGSVPSDERMELVDTFNKNDDVFAFLISTKAGGTGLNLTAANKVVIFDPNWNPSHDLQAMDRSYRYGQTRNVEVYRLIGAGTLEENIYHRQQQKRNLAATAYTAENRDRLYVGVEGDRTQQGELYGVNNLFKLSEHFDLLNKTIKKCEIQELLDPLVVSPALLPDAGTLPKEPTKPTKAKKSKEKQDDDDDSSDEGNVSEGQPAASQVEQTEEQISIAKILEGTVRTVSDLVLRPSKPEQSNLQKLLEDPKSKPKRAVPTPIPPPQKTRAIAPIRRLPGHAASNKPRLLPATDWNPWARQRPTFPPPRDSKKVVKREI